MQYAIQLTWLQVMFASRRKWKENELDVRCNVQQGVKTLKNSGCVCYRQFVVTIMCCVEVVDSETLEL